MDQVVPSTIDFKIGLLQNQVKSELKDIIAEACMRVERNEVTPPSAYVGYFGFTMQTDARLKGHEDLRDLLNGVALNAKPKFQINSSAEKISDETVTTVAEEFIELHTYLLGTDVATQVENISSKFQWNIIWHMQPVVNHPMLRSCICKGDGIFKTRSKSISQKRIDMNHQLYWDFCSIIRSYIDKLLLVQCSNPANEVTAKINYLQNLAYLYLTVKQYMHINVYVKDEHDFATVIFHATNAYRIMVTEVIAIIKYSNVA